MEQDRFYYKLNSKRPARSRQQGSLHSQQSAEGSENYLDQDCEYPEMASMSREAYRTYGGKQRLPTSGINSPGIQKRGKVAGKGSALSRVSPTRHKKSASNSSSKLPKKLEANATKAVPGGYSLGSTPFG